MRYVHTKQLQVREACVRVGRYRCGEAGLYRNEPRRDHVHCLQWIHLETTSAVDRSVSPLFAPIIRLVIPGVPRLSWASPSPNPENSRRVVKIRYDALHVPLPERQTTQQPSYHYKVYLIARCEPFGRPLSYCLERDQVIGALKTRIQLPPQE